ncbi:response regulator [Ningiella sp. W23]|uniref:response regulator n=1 Tax=Ningiella sp. W23 TaxID=3023715 RepID=UPI003756752D
MAYYSNLLLVEDDIALASWIMEFLRNEGFGVVHVERGDLVVNAMRKEHYNLILLDLMLPGLNGIEVCKRVREFSNIPIIMLTAKVDELDEVVGLEVGANDYVTKPVRPRALLARIKAVLRDREMEKTISKDVLNFGKLTIDKSSKRVTLDDTEVPVSTSLFDFLWLLASNSGQVVSREEVFQVLKSREYDGQDRRFDVMVSSLRKLLNDDNKHYERIKTIWGKGYLFVSDAWDN